MQCPRCQHENRPQAKYCDDCGTPLQRLEGAVQPVPSHPELQRSLTEALDQQTATAEILRVISGCRTDAKRVFDMIAESAARLCEAQYCFVYRFEAQLLHFAAHHGLTAEVLEINRRAYPAPPSRKSVAARVVLERSVVQIPDVNADPDYALGAMAAAAGYHSAAAVPILRDGLAIGSIAVTRAKAGLLPDRQIELLKTFADQAVIAIENVQLFTELQEKNRELSEALEQQTPTSEVLKVICRSTFDVQPVFETLAEHAVRLCEAERGLIFRFDGQFLRFTVGHNVSPALVEFFTQNPMAPGRGSNAGRAALERRTVHNHDVLSDPEYSYGGYRVDPYRTVLAIPMLRADELLGVILIYRHEVRPFTDGQVALMETFADQAVIAIENVRLFTELQARNRHLTESLAQQTATSEVLRVISSSPTNEQPVFDAIVRSARSLCEASFSVVFLAEEGQLKLAAVQGVDSAGIAALQEVYPRPVGRDTTSGRAILDRRVVHLEDSRLDPE